MRKALISTLAVAGLTVAGLTGPAAGAPNASAAPDSTMTAAGCSTYQFRVMDKTGLYRPAPRAGGGEYPVRKGTAWRGYYLNAPSQRLYPMAASRTSTRTAYFRYGNVYDRNKNLVAKGIFVREGMLAPFRCW